MSLRPPWRGGGLARLSARCRASCGAPAIPWARRAPLLGLLAGAVCGLVAGCGAPRGPTKAQLQAATAALQRVGADADPGLVALREISFARAAREIGQWPAHAEFAAPGALLESKSGQVGVDELAAWAAPAEPAAWAPTHVWSSCDGSLAVSRARYREDGLIGSLVTVWTRDFGQPYRWIYRAGMPDNPQPQAAGPGRSAGADEIVVDALGMINARTADCPRTDEPPPPPPPEIPAGLTELAEARFLLTRSADWTLQYFWHHHPGGERRLVVEYLRGGAWEQALQLVLPPVG